MNSTHKPARVVIVTGASRGIGRAIAVAFARDGWSVCFNYLANAAAANETAALIEKAGGKALAVQADVARQDDVRRLFAESHRAFGRLDALVNNAGIAGEGRSIFDADEAHLLGVFGANVFGSFYCASEAAKQMSTKKGGHGGSIVNISSVAARTGGFPNEVHYASSKGAIDSFTLGLSRELAPHGIRVNAVRPGLIDTTIHEAHGGQATLDRLAPTVPLGRIADPDEVAQAVTFLCSPQASYIRGVLLAVSGGR
jgi:NAD(P)-dependent dehydrogenase (short-subunit alcohol dehydrogenase family)